MPPRRLARGRAELAAERVAHSRRLVGRSGDRRHASPARELAAQAVLAESATRREAVFVERERANIITFGASATTLQQRLEASTTRPAPRRARARPRGGRDAARNTLGRTAASRRRRFRETRGNAAMACSARRRGDVRERGDRREADAAFADARATASGPSSWGARRGGARRASQFADQRRARCWHADFSDAFQPAARPRRRRGPCTLGGRSARRARSAAPVAARAASGGREAGAREARDGPIWNARLGVDASSAPRVEARCR